MHGPWRGSRPGRASLCDNRKARRLCPFAPQSIDILSCFISTPRYEYGRRLVPSALFSCSFAVHGRTRLAPTASSLSQPNRLCTLRRETRRRSPFAGVVLPGFIRCLPADARPAQPRQTGAMRSLSVRFARRGYFALAAGPGLFLSKRLSGSSASGERTPKPFLRRNRR